MSEVGGRRSQSVAEAGRGATRGGQGGHLESLMFGLAAVHLQSSSTAHLQTARRRRGARRGALGHREDLVDGSDGRQRVAVLDGDAAHLGVVLDCDLEVWEKCGSRERWDSVCCRGKGSSTRREQNMRRGGGSSCPRHPRPEAHHGRLAARRPGGNRSRRKGWRWRCVAARGSGASVLVAQGAQRGVLGPREALGLWSECQWCVDARERNLVGKKYRGKLSEAGSGGSQFVPKAGRAATE